MLKEQKKAKELVIKITDTKEKENLQLIATKNLVGKLQNATKNIVGVTCLPNGNVKVYTKSKKIKKKLQKDSTWINIIAISAAI